MKSTKTVTNESEKDDMTSSEVGVIGSSISGGSAALGGTAATTAVASLSEAHLRPHALVTGDAAGDGGGSGGSGGGAVSALGLGGRSTASATSPPLGRSGAVVVV